MNVQVSPFNSFDEAQYLKLNPDVSEAVQNGMISSGWEHYFLQGVYEKRPGVMSEVERAVSAHLEDVRPFPPEYLRKRVHGDEEISLFMKIGRMIAFNIYSSISPLIALNKESAILDFGCGCGRIIRGFYKFFEKSNFYGTDIDDEAISWCQQQLSEIGNFFKNQISPPLPFADETFDFVYSVSVFTHLPEDMQFEWLLSTSYDRGSSSWVRLR